VFGDEQEGSDTGVGATGVGATGVGATGVGVVAQFVGATLAELVEQSMLVAPILVRSVV
jgi:hypothetical protein